MGRQDISALIASFRENYQDLLRFLTRRTGDAERAADLAQDTFLKLAALGLAHQEVRNARAYIYRTAANLVIDTVRRDRRIARDFTFSESRAAVADPTPSAEDVLAARDRLQQLEAALDEL